MRSSFFSRTLEVEVVVSKQDPNFDCDKHTIEIKLKRHGKKNTLVKGQLILENQ
jgi:hypothetical protein